VHYWGIGIAGAIIHLTVVLYGLYLATRLVRAYERSVDRPRDR
jgi:hypothetical protein